MLFRRKRKPTIHWGAQDGYRVISFSDGTAELQKMNLNTYKFDCIRKGKGIDLVLVHLHWLSGCEGNILGFRKL